MFYHIIWCSSSPLCDRIVVFQFSLLCYKFCILSKQNARAFIIILCVTMTAVRKLVGNKCNCPETCDFFSRLGIFLFLHETSNTEKFDCTDVENSNSFFSNSSRKYPNTQMQTFVWRLRSVFVLSETLSELNSFSRA